MEKILLFTLPLIVLFGGINFFRPIPKLQAQYELSAPASSQPVRIAWPKAGQAAIGAVGYGLLDAKPTDEAVPIASVAKIMTALAVLKQKPLASSETGPKLIFTKNDVALYQKYLAKDGSVVPVKVGDQMTEYQALEAMLIPSANNIADSLAVWAYGSMANYLTAANQMASQLGMSTTHFADASGFSPKTISTARDLVLLGQAAVSNSVIVKIVQQKSVKLPGAGRLSNTNWLLGSHGIDGIKTGHTDQAGGCFLFSSEQIIGGQSVALIGAVTGASDSTSALNSSLPLITSARQGFKSVKIADQGQVVASYRATWGDNPAVITSQKVNVLSWRGQPMQLNFDLPPIAPGLKAGDRVGQLKIKTGQRELLTDLVLKNDVRGPSWTWRLFR